MRPYDATTDASEGALRDDAETTANIRILDPALVTKTFSQLERVQQYYQFPTHLDVDRYEIDGKLQDTVIAVRELKQSGQSSNSWYNNTIVYTHGFGVVAAYGNQRTLDGQPLFLESGIPSTGDARRVRAAHLLRRGLPELLDRRRIRRRPVELDYPSGAARRAPAARTRARPSQSDGGPMLDNFLKKLVYAIKFQSEQHPVLRTRSPTTRRSSTTAARWSACRRSRRT